MIRARELVGKSYGEANALTGLEFDLRDHNTDHHKIQDLAQAETYIGIAEALQPENNSPTLTQKFSRLRNLSDYVSSRFNNFKHTKTAAALAAAGMISAATFGALTKDLGVELPDIIMENAEAQSPDDTNDGTYKITKLAGDTNEMANWPKINEDLVLINYPLSHEFQIHNLDGSNFSSRYPLAAPYGGGPPADIDNGYLAFITRSNSDSEMRLIKLDGTQNTTLQNYPESDGLSYYLVFDHPYIVSANQIINDNESLQVHSVSGELINEITIAEADSIVAPNIYGNAIVFVNENIEPYTSSDIYLATSANGFKDITVQQISPVNNGGCFQSEPVISDKNIAWITPGDCELKGNIYIYDRDTQKIKNTLEDVMPESLAIYEDTLVWSDPPVIYIHNINTGKEIQITDVGNYIPHVDVWENKVVWSDDNSDVYLAEFSFDESNVSDNPQIIPNTPDLLKLVEKHSPTYLFSQGEKYFPTNPYADDSDVNNNVLNWQEAKFPDDNSIYYSVTEYPNKISVEHPEGFKVIQYWSYYVYNDWGSDKHQYDWEVIHKWVDNKSGEVFYTSASMHLWDNTYQGDMGRFLVEEGGHGMSKDTFMLDHIKMSFNDVGVIQDANSYELRPLEDLLKYRDIDFPGERGKFPTEQNRYKDPDRYVRLNPVQGALTQLSIKNSPELSVVDSSGSTTGLKNGKIIEYIPYSKYFPAEERIITLGTEKPTIFLKGTADEDYTLEAKNIIGAKEELIIKRGTIKKDEIIKLEYVDLQKDNSENNLQNTHWQTLGIAAIGGAVAGAIGLTAYRQKQRSKPKKSKKSKKR